MRTHSLIKLLLLTGVLVGGLLGTTHPANAYWCHGGRGYGGWGPHIVVGVRPSYYYRRPPVVYVAPPVIYYPPRIVYAVPPAYYASPPAY